MLRRKHISLLLVLVVALFAICAATGAWAGTYKVLVDGKCDANDDPGTCIVTQGGWVIELAAGTSTGHMGEFPVVCSGTDFSDECKDKKGNPITGYRFGYYIKAPSGGTLAQANVLCPDCSDKISITYPTDRSVKLLDQDPNTLFGLGPSLVITWDALKLDQSGKTFIAVYTTRAGVGTEGMLLKTGTGNEITDSILGPACCTGPQNITLISTGSNPNGSDGITTPFDQCTGVLDEKNLDPRLAPVTTSLWHCNAPLSDKSVSCALINRIGPASGSFIDVTSDAVSPGATYSGTRYYGYGNKFYKAAIEGIFPTLHYCDQNTASSRLYEQVMVFDHKMKVTYNQCGDVTSVKDYATEADYADVTMYIFESDIDPSKAHATVLSGGLAVNSGPSHGGVFEGTTCGYFGGVWKCCYYVYYGRCY